jgi:hypothetical protein
VGRQLCEDETAAESSPSWPMRQYYDVVANHDYFSSLSPVMVVVVAATIAEGAGPSTN